MRGGPAAISATGGLGRGALARQISKSVSLVQAIELGQRAATPDVTDDLEA